MDESTDMELEMQEMDQTFFLPPASKGAVNASRLRLFSSTENHRAQGRGRRAQAQLG